MRTLGVWLEPGYDGGGLGAWLVDVPGVFAAVGTPQRALSAILTATARTREWLEGHGDDLGLGSLARVEVAGETAAIRQADGYEVNATFPWDRRPLTADEVATAVRRLGWLADDLLELAAAVDRFEDRHGPLPHGRRDGRAHGRRGPPARGRGGRVVRRAARGARARPGPRQADGDRVARGRPGLGA